MTDHVYIVVDTETTGFDRQRTSTITQVAAVAVDAASGKFLSQGTIRVKVTADEIRTFTKEAMDVQGWTPELNDLGIPLDACREQLHAWLGTYPSILGYVAHAARFDKIFFERLKLHPVDRPWLCTKEGMYVLERKNIIKFENHKLSTLAKHCGYQQLAAHQALDDVLACANGFQWLRAMGATPEAMVIQTAAA